MYSLPSEMKVEIFYHLGMNDLLSARLVHSTWVFPASYLIKKIEHKVQFTKKRMLGTFIKEMKNSLYFPYSKFQISIATYGQSDLEKFSSRFGPEVVEHTMILPPHNNNKSTYFHRVNTLLHNTSRLRSLTFLCERSTEGDKMEVIHNEMTPKYMNAFPYLQYINFNWFLEDFIDLKMLFDICKNSPNLLELKLFIQLCYGPPSEQDKYDPAVAFFSLVSAIPKIQILKLSFVGIENEHRLMDFENVPRTPLELKELEILNGIDLSTTSTYTPSLCHILQGVLTWFSTNAQNLKILRFEKLPYIPYVYAQANVNFPVFPKLEELDMTYGPRAAFTLTQLKLPRLKRLRCHIGQIQAFFPTIFHSVEQLELDPFGQTFNGNQWKTSFPNVWSLTANGRLPEILFKQKNFNLNLKEFKIPNAKDIFPYMYFVKNENIIMDLIKLIHNTCFTCNEASESQQQNLSQYFGFSTLKNLKVLFLGKCDAKTIQGVMALSCVGKLTPLTKLSLHCIQQIPHNFYATCKTILEKYHNQVHIEMSQ